MTSKTNKRFNYKEVFELIERSLIEEAYKNKPITKVKDELDRYKKKITLTDEKCFEKLIMTTFYSGFKADTVTRKKQVILGHFPSWEKVSTYTEEDVERIVSDPKMIRHRGRIEACAKNAQEFKKIIEKHGSFGKYVEGFEAESFENLMILKEDLEARFDYLGPITVYDFLKEIGIPVLKPDRVIMRIFERLGLIDHREQFLRAIFHGREFARITEHPIRYIDTVFVAYGQVATSDLGIERGICLEVNPSCNLCYAKPYCNFYQENGMLS